MSATPWQRIPLILSFPDKASFSETYGFAGNSGKVNLEGQLLRAPDSKSQTLYVFMHPTSTLQLLPMPTALADAGLHVMCAASRYPKNDSGADHGEGGHRSGRVDRHAKTSSATRRSSWSAGPAAARCRSSIRPRPRTPPSPRRRPAIPSTWSAPA